MVTLRKLPKESMSGKCEIQKEGKHFADCTYIIYVEQEIIVTETLPNSQTIPGMFSYSGVVILNQSELLKPGVLEGMNSGGAFTLHLSDAKIIKTSFNPILEENNPFNRKYKIIPEPG